MKIGLISDTHGYIDNQILSFFDKCDEIWHAGDIGDPQVSDQLRSLRSFKAVHGNIDGYPLRAEYPANLLFHCEGLKVYITHIGGYPGNYSQESKKIIESEKPGLFICGHSHILKVMPDKKNELLHINPGAAGRHGFHKIRTLVRFSITASKIHDLEVIELGLRSSF